MYTNLRIEKNQKEPCDKIKLLIQFKDSEPVWAKPIEIDYSLNVNKRIIEKYINSLRNQTEKDIVEEAYQGFSKGGQKIQKTQKKRLTKKEMKILEQEQRQQKALQLKQEEKINKVKEILTHEIIPKSEQKETTSPLSLFKFQIKFQDDHVDWLFSNEIKTFYKENVEKICEYILSQRENPDFDELRIINMSGKQIFYEYISQKNISIKQLSQDINTFGINKNIYEEEKQRESQLNYNEHDSQVEYIDTNQGVNDKMQEQQELIQFTKTVITNFIKENEQINSYQTVSEQNNFSESSQQQAQFYKSKQDILKSLFKNPLFHIKSNNPSNIQTIADTLNIFVQQFLIINEEQINNLMKFAQTQKFENQHENQNLAELTFRNVEMILFDPIKDCFFTPELVGVIEQDQIDRYISRNFNIKALLLVGNEKSYIYQYTVRKSDQIGSGVIRKVENNWYLFENKLQKKLPLENSRDQILEWIKDIQQIDIFQMKLEKENDQKSHLKRIKNFFEKGINQKIPEKYEKLMKKDKSKKQNN